MEKLCRACMCESTDVKNLFDDNDNAIGDQSSHFIADMFMACASVEIKRSDLLPKIICAQCNFKLSVAFEFKQQCEKTDSSLRRLVSPNVDEMIEIKPDVNDYDYYDDNADINSSESTETSITKSNEESLRCTLCAREFHSKNDFKFHLQEHKNEKLFSCQICHQKFSKNNLYKHLQSAHKTDAECDTFTCRDCGLSFPTAYLLSEHMEEHRSQVCIKDESREDDNIDVSEYFKNECHSIEIQDTKIKDKHKCKYCDKVLTTFARLKIHMKQHAGDDLHVCAVCKKTFTKSNHLKRHMLTHGVTMGVTEHGVSKDSDTPSSSLIVMQNDNKEDEEEFTTQNETDSPDPSNAKDDIADKIDLIPDNDFLTVTRTTRSYTCHVCQKNFLRPINLTRHMTFHKAVLIHKCDRCDKAFAIPEYLEEHMQKDHIEKPYMCTICQKTYSKGQYLIRHLKTHLNSQEIDIKCSICEKEFSRSDHLAKHIKQHLQEDKRYVCKECGKAFNRLDNLKTHQKIHSGQKDNSKLYLCIYCGKEFNNSSNMIVHMRRHTGERPYKCSICGKGFPRSNDLKYHERTHSGEKPYLCTVCGKAFIKSNKLLRHARVHTGEKPYACKLCDKAFKQSNDLAFHVRKHTGARPYACEMCPARFIKSGQLKAHRQSTGHCMETQPDQKGELSVEAAAPLSKSVPVNDKKKEGELIEVEPRESQPECKPADVMTESIVVEETKPVISYQPSDVLAYNPISENVEELCDRIKSEV